MRRHGRLRLINESNGIFHYDRWHSLIGTEYAAHIIAQVSELHFRIGQERNMIDISMLGVMHISFPCHLTTECSSATCGKTIQPDTMVDFFSGSSCVKKYAFDGTLRSSSAWTRFGTLALVG